MFVLSVVILFCCVNFHHLPLFVELSGSGCLGPQRNQNDSGNGNLDGNWNGIGNCCCLSKLDQNFYSFVNQIHVWLGSEALNLPSGVASEVLLVSKLSLTYFTKNGYIERVERIWRVYWVKRL